MIFPSDSHPGQRDCQAQHESFSLIQSPRWTVHQFVDFFSQFLVIFAESFVYDDVVVRKQTTNIGAIDRATERFNKRVFPSFEARWG